MFVRVLGTWTIPIEADSVDRTLVRAGERAGRVEGGQEDRSRGQGVEISATSGVLSGEDADALEGLLLGLAHVFPFDAHFFSKAGLAPLATSGATISAVQSKWGGFSASITLLQWAVAFVIAPGVWTVALWRWSGAAWVHYVVRSDGAKWVDGVRNDAAVTTFLTFDTALGVISLSGSPHFFDDAVFFPFKLSTAAVATVRAAMVAGAFPHPGALSYDGTIFQNSEVKVMRASGVENVEAPHSNTSSGSQAWDRRGARISFTLREVIA